MQDAVNPVLDGHFLIAGFDVNIAGAPLQRVEDGGVHQLDHRRDIGIARRQAVDRQRLVGILFVPDHVERKTLGDFVQHALRLLGFLEQVGDLRECRDLDAELLAQQHGQFVDQAEIARVGQGDVERPVVSFDGHEVVAEHQVHRDGGEQVVIDADFPQIHELVVVALGHGAGARGFLERIYGRTGHLNQSLSLKTLRPGYCYY